MTFCLQQFLTTQRLGRSLLHLDSCDSTNKVALREALCDAPEGLLVVADTQTSGRGRMTRNWFSPSRDNLYASFLLRPPCPVSHFPQLPILAAISLHQALRLVCPDIRFGLKWPNDLQAHGRKISGILCESGCNNRREFHAVIGVGVNLNTKTEDFPEDLKGSAASLHSLTGKSFSREQLVAELLNAFEALYTAWLSAGSMQPFLPYWHDFDCLKGETVKLQQPDGDIVGTACGMAEDGQLLLDVAGTVQNFCCGDVIHVRKT